MEMEQAHEEGLLFFDYMKVYLDIKLKPLNTQVFKFNLIPLLLLLLLLKKQFLSKKSKMRYTRRRCLARTHSLLNRNKCRSVRIISWPMNHPSIYTL